MKSMLKICTLKMLLNFIVIVQEPWKASVSEVNQITPRDGTEPRVLDVNNGAVFSIMDVDQVNSIDGETYQSILPQPKCVAVWAD